MGIVVKNEQRGAEEWGGDNELSVFSTQCLVPCAGCCRQRRDNDLMLPTMIQTAICYLNPCAQCGGRVNVAFQIHWKRQASVVADSQDCRTSLMNEHSPELMKQPTFQLVRGHSLCPKPRTTTQEDNCAPNLQKHRQPSLRHTLCYFKNRKQYKHSRSLRSRFAF